MQILARARLHALHSLVGPGSGRLCPRRRTRVASLLRADFYSSFDSDRALSWRRAFGLAAAQCPQISADCRANVAMASFGTPLALPQAGAPPDFKGRLSSVEVVCLRNGVWARGRSLCARTAARGLGPRVPLNNSALPLLHPSLTLPLPAPRVIGQNVAASVKPQIFCGALGAGQFSPQILVRRQTKFNTTWRDAGRDPTCPC